MASESQNTQKPEAKSIPSPETDAKLANATPPPDLDRANLEAKFLEIMQGTVQQQLYHSYVNTATSIYPAIQNAKKPSECGYLSWIRKYHYHLANLLEANERVQMVSDRTPFETRVETLFLAWGALNEPFMELAQWKAGEARDFNFVDGERVRYDGQEDIMDLEGRLPVTGLRSGKDLPGSGGMNMGA